MQCMLCQLARPLTGQVWGQPPTPAAVTHAQPPAATMALPRRWAVSGRPSRRSGGQLQSTHWQAGTHPPVGKGCFALAGRQHCTAPPRGRGLFCKNRRASVRCTPVGKVFLHWQAGRQHCTALHPPVGKGCFALAGSTAPGAAHCPPLETGFLVAVPPTPSVHAVPVCSGRCSKFVNVAAPAQWASE